MELPMEAPAPPARLSTITDLPRMVASACATGRAARSAWPPAGNGTIIVMLRSGQVVSAKAELENVASGSAAVAFKSSRRSIDSFLPGDFCFGWTQPSPNRRTRESRAQLLLLLPLREML